MQTPMLGRFCIKKKHRLWFFTWVQKLKVQFFLKFGPGSGSDVQKVPEKCVIPNVKVQDYIIFVSAICQQKIINKLTN